MSNLHHPAISTVLSTLKKAEFWLEFEAQTSEPLDRTLDFPTVISDLRGAARYVWTTERNSTAAALLMMTAIYLKQLKESTGYPGFPFQMRNELDELIYSTDELATARPNPNDENPLLLLRDTIKPIMQEDQEDQDSLF